MNNSTPEALTIELVQLLEEIEVKMNRIKEIKIIVDSQAKTKVKKDNMITCVCGCVVCKSSLKRHQLTKKHNDIINKEVTKEVIIKEVVKEEIIKEVVKEKIDNDCVVHEEIDFINETVHKLLKHTNQLFYKGLYVSNYKNQNYLNSNLINDIHTILEKIFNEDKPKDYKDILTIWNKNVYKSLDEHLKEYPINNIAVDDKPFFDSICKLKKNEIPLKYCLNNVAKFKESIYKNLYNDYADMKNREVEHILIKDFVSNSVKDLIKKHITKYGINEKDSNEYLLLLQEIDDAK